MEEILRRKGLDFFIDVGANGIVTLLHRRGDGIQAAQRFNAHGKAGVFQRPGKHLGVVSGQRIPASVQQGIKGFGVGVKLKQPHFGMILGKVGFRRGSLADDQRLARQLLRRSNQRRIGRYHAQGYLHVGQSKIHHLSARGGHGEVGQDDIHLGAGQILHAVGGVHGNQLKLHTQILRQAACKIHVVALIIAIFIHIAKWLLIREHTDNQRAAILDILQRAGTGIRQGGGGKQQRQGQSQSQNLYKLTHFHILLSVIFSIFATIKCVPTRIRRPTRSAASFHSSFLLVYKKGG